MADKSEQDEPQWQRRRRLARIFGDVLPDSTTDDRDPEDAGVGSDNEEWLKRQVPPHHGGA